MECFIPNFEPSYTTFDTQRKSYLPNIYDQGEKEGAENTMRLYHSDASHVISSIHPGYTLTDLDSRHPVATVNPFEGTTKTVFPLQLNQKLDHQANRRTALSSLFQPESTACMFPEQIAPMYPFISRSPFALHGKLDTPQDPAMRSRPCFSSQQTRELEREFVSGQYITRKRRVELAYALDLTEKQIKTWFQNRRVKERKTKKTEKP